MKKTVTKTPSAATERPAEIIDQAAPTPAPEGAAFEQVFRWLEDYIRDNHIEIGDLLPSEDEIMREMQLSRSSIREAITRLRALGIVESRRKRGMRLVRSPKLLDLVRLLNSTAIPMEQLGHVGGFRCALEMGFWSEIFRRATPDDIAELRQIYEKMVANGDDPVEWNMWDCRFHQKLIYITGNNVAIWLSQLINPFFASIRGYVTPLSEHVRVLHESIVRSLENHDPEAFYAALHDHNGAKLSFDHSWFIPKTIFERRIG